MKRFKALIKSAVISAIALTYLFLGTATRVYATENEPPIPAVVVLTGYDIEDGYLQAGHDVTINFDVENASKAVTVYSLVISVTSQSNMVYPAYGSDNQVYVGTLAPGENKTVSIDVAVNPTLTADMTDIECQFNYVSAGKQMSNKSVLVVPTTGARTIAVRSIDVSPIAKVNGKTLVSIGLVNNGTSNITDARLVIDGDVTEDSKSIPLDTLYFGKSLSEDYQITFMGLGEQKIGMKLEFTDVDGSNQTIDLGDFTVTVEDGAAQVNGKSNNSYRIVIGNILFFGALAAVIGLTGFYIYKR